AHIVIVGGGGDVVELPGGAVPVDDGPGAGVALGSGHVVTTGNDEEDGVAVGVELGVLHVDEPSLGFVVPNEGGALGIGEGRFQGGAVYGVPGLPHVV